MSIIRALTLVIVVITIVTGIAFFENTQSASANDSRVHTPGSSPFATIQAVATGGIFPHQVQPPATVTNGDFLITGNEGSDEPVGDGRNEKTTWALDFSSQIGFKGFPISASLQSALLTIKIMPGGLNVSTDSINIKGLIPIRTPLIQNVPVDRPSIVRLELLDFYSSSDILDVLAASVNGELPMEYRDDAVVSYAKLMLISSVERCTLDIEASYADRTITIDYTLGTLEPAKWDLWAGSKDALIRIESNRVPITDPPISRSISFSAFNPHGTVAVWGTIKTLGWERNCFVITIVR